jgi:hypothetical protein
MIVIMIVMLQPKTHISSLYSSGGAVNDEWHDGADFP